MCALLHTSQSDPIRVDFLPAAALPAPGRLGMTLAPGKKGPGIHAHWDRDLGVDLARLCGHYRADVLVSLIEAHELKLLAIPALYEQAEAHGLRVIRFPIRDVSVPAFTAGLRDLVAHVLALVQAGRTVVVHCRGGLGRTGLVAACALVAAGHDPAAAMATVRRARPGAIETREQEEYVSRFQAAWRQRGPRP
ncbi:MAG: cyclin-dependent kinase inhibitor 3 family protein [Armatimonadetes bacterium]|nr:cyclin-dependent kinase inhibitor 3 family protein [Armatimonadota bacterium]